MSEAAPNTLWVRLRTPTHKGSWFLVEGWQYLLGWATPIPGLPNQFVEITCSDERPKDD